MPDYLTTDQKAALGALVFQAGALERTVDWMFSGLLRIDTDLYHELVDGRMLGWKLATFKALGLTRLRTDAQRRRFTAIMDALLGLNGERTTAVHGEWLPGGTGVTIAELLGVAPPRPAVAKHRRRGSTRVSELRAERLAATAEQLELSTAALFKFFVDHWISPRVRRAVRREQASGKQP